VSGASLAETTRAELARPALTAGIGHLALATRAAAVGAAIFAVAALARLAAIDTYVTIDESRWVQRTADFSALIGQGNLEDTFIIGHPGVTTMWTALLGLGADRARQFSFLEGRTDATRRDGYYEALGAARRPFALVGALGVAAVGLLGWRLLGAGAGIVGALLLAFEPFLVAQARVVHLDSGLTTYMAVAALSGLIYWTAGGAWPFLALSGLATGLAFLTKAPSVFVIGFVPLVAGLAWLTDGRRKPAGLAALALELAAWAAIAAAVGCLLWPALRLDPVGTILKMAQFTERVGGGEHDNYFVGRVTDDPGLFFYPLALVLRLAPATLVGVVLLAALRRRLDPARRRPALLLTLYCVGFTAMMTIGPKKFDRYILPIFPMLGLLAGLGLWLAARSVRLPTRSRRPPLALAHSPSSMWIASVGLAVLLIAVGIQAASFLSVVRYPLAFYSPLLGGGAIAERLILVGWGEGLDQAADWLNDQPRPLGEPTVATSYHRVLQARLVGSAVPLEHVRMADYVVPYVNTLQRGAEADVLGPYLASGAVEHAVRIDGIEYARVYRGPHYPAGADLGVELGGRVVLVGFVAAPGSGNLRPGEELAVGLRWDRAASAQERAVVAVLAADGRTVVQDELPLGADGPDERGQPGELHRLTVPPRTPPGTYRLVARVLDGRGRAPLPVSAGPEVGQDLVPLRELSVERAP
jgi:hypothetical protein